MSSARIIEMPKPRRSRQTPLWSTWSNPVETEKDYDKWRQQHKDYLMMQVRTQVEKIGNGLQEAPVNLLAARSGLSSATVSKYVRKIDMGKRGPLATTLVALLKMREGE